MPEQFGFKANVSQEAANSWLPPLPRTNDSPSPFFSADGHFDVTSVYEPLSLQYPPRTPLLLSSGDASGSYDFSFQPPASYKNISQSYAFNADGSMVEGIDPEDAMMVSMVESDDMIMEQYFDF